MCQKGEGVGGGRPSHVEKILKNWCSIMAFGGPCSLKMKPKATVSVDRFDIMTIE